MNDQRKLTLIHYTWEEHENIFQEQFPGFVCLFKKLRSEDSCSFLTSTQNSPPMIPFLDHVLIVSKCYYPLSHLDSLPPFFLVSYLLNLLFVFVLFFLW